MMMNDPKGTGIYNAFRGDWYLWGTNYYESYMENLYAKALIQKNTDQTSGLVNHPIFSI
jgi:hypothetical protein